MQQDLLLKCKPLVDYWKASVVHDNAAYNLSVNLDTFLLAVDNAIMDHRMMHHEVSYQGAGHLYHLQYSLPLEVMCLLFKSWEL